MDYIIKNLDTIPLEGTHDLPNSRQTIFTNQELPSDAFSAFTKGILDSGKIWDWHMHSDLYEFFIVISGTGYVEFEDGTKHEYKEKDSILVKPNYEHRIVANGNTPSEFYFVRMQ